MRRDDINPFYDTRVVETRGDIVIIETFVAGRPASIAEVDHSSHPPVTTWRPHPLATRLGCAGAAGILLVWLAFWAAVAVALTPIHR